MTGEREFRFNIPVEKYTLGNGERGGNPGVHLCISYPEGVVHTPEFAHRLEGFFAGTLEVLKRKA